MEGGESISNNHKQKTQRNITSFPVNRNTNNYQAQVTIGEPQDTRIPPQWGREIHRTQTSYDGQNRTVLQAHERLGHSNEYATRATSDAIGMKLRKGGMGTCLACTIGKAKQKNVKKKSEGIKIK
jgi:hypothetical protein